MTDSLKEGFCLLPLINTPIIQIHMLEKMENPRRNVEPQHGIYEKHWFFMEKKLQKLMTLLMKLKNFQV